MNKTRDGGFNIIQSMQLDPSLCFSELGPPEYAQTQISGCGIEGIYVSINNLLKIFY